MGAFLRLVDAVLFLCFLVVAFAAPLNHSEDWLPLSDDQTPQFLVDLRSWYASSSGNYLLLERPRFFIGLVWLELLLTWPLSVANVYGIFTSKPWFSTTCLISGLTVFCGMAAIVPELFGSGKATDKLLRLYYFFWGFSALAILRGLLGNCSNTASTISTIKSPAHIKIKKKT